MGISGLMKLISEEAPDAIKEFDGFGPLNGRKVAIDASMAMYQFLVAVRTGSGGNQQQLTNENGDVTSHIQGMFNRTIRMMEAGIKPCYVFDGKPPPMKSGELAKRIARRKKAEKDLEAAKAAGDGDDIDRFQRRLVKVTKQHNEECKELLRLMGVPCITAPCEAEAQCAELNKHGKVYGTATEDMDALTFRTPKLIRKLFSQSTNKDKNSPVVEIDVEKVLTEMKLSYEQFVDLCILCGCDYCDTIKGVGPKGALKLIREHKTIEASLAHIRKNEKKKEIPADWKEQRVSKKAMAEAMALKEKAEREREEKDIAEAKALKEAALAAASTSSAATFAPADENASPAEANAGADAEILIQDASPSSSAPAADAAVPAAEGAVSSSVSGFESGTGTAGDVAAPAPTTATATATATVPVTAATDADGDDEPVAADINDDDAKAEPEAAEPTETAAEPERKEPEPEEEDEEIAEDDLEIVPPIYEQARNLFVKAPVQPAAECDLKWTGPDVDGLRKFLIDRMCFNAERVNKNIEKLQKCNSNKTQMHLGDFFGVTGTVGTKRKPEPAKGKGAKAAKKGSFGKKR